MTQKTWTVARDLSATSFENVAVNLYDLYMASLKAGQNGITGRTFTNCRLEGPVVLAPISGNTFDGVHFGPNVAEAAMLVLRPASPNGVVGALPVRDCRFVNCHFIAVGYTGAEAFLNQLLALGST